jgi:TRAP-type C4-dicarboxylate transport system permease small subunit
LRRLGRWFSNCLDKVEEGLTIASALSIAFIMAYTVAGVVARVAGAPIQGVTEYTTLIFVWVILFPIAFAQRRGEHLSMGILFDRLSPRAQRLTLCVLLCLGIFISFLIAWSGLYITIWAYEMGDVLLGVIPVPTWWSRMAMPIGLSIATVRLVVQLVQVIKVIKKEDMMFRRTRI